MTALAPALFLLAMAAGGTPEAVTLRGRVVDARTGEPVAKALVSLRDQHLETVTNAAGAFEIAGVPAGAADLYVSTVGYGLVKQRIEVVPGAAPLEIALGQDAIKRSEAVSVRAGVFDPVDRDAPAQQTLDNSELRNLASVIADDSLRAVQALPGVATGDDFNATFSVRGSGFASMGFYIDGVLTRAPFHTVRDVNDGYSLTILNGDLVDSVALVSGAAPARYGDRVAAVLNVQTRDGGREKMATRAHLGAAGVSFSNEGPIGKDKKASWLVGGRKSFLDYIISRLEAEPTLVVSYWDLQGKLAYNPSGAHQLSLLLLHGDARWREEEDNPSALEHADARTDLATLRWRWSPSARTVFAAAASLYDEAGRNRNANDETLFRSDFRDLGFRADLTRALGARHTVEGGLLFRRTRDEALEQRFAPAANAFKVANTYDASSWQPAAYLQDTWVAVPNRCTLTVGGRFDSLALTGEDVWSPRASVTVSLSSRTRISASAGRYAQFPSFEALFGPDGNPALEAERSTQYVVAAEHLLTDTVRLGVQAYHQEERGRLFVRDSEFRLADGRVVFPRPEAAFSNALHGPSRGVEISLQRRSANGLSGWLSYALGHARLYDDVTGQAYDSDYDQRHTFNAYVSHRLTNTLNLSVKYRYGSNLPIPGFYREEAGAFYLAEERNRVRVPVYSRLDVRAARAFFYTRWKMTVYAEVSNVLDRDHYRYSGDGSIDLRTGRVFLESDKLFPILPAAGVTVEF